MSDVVLVAIIGGSFTFAGIILTHLLNKQDRSLASDVVKAKDKEITILKVSHDLQITEKDATIACLRRQLDTRNPKT